jgi:hypothetical protein
VFVPTRGRPAKAVELELQVRKTIRATTTVVFVVDADDPLRDAYTSLELTTLVVPAARDGMVAALNRAWESYVVGEQTAVAFMGDDHRPRTDGWDAAYLAALNELGTGLVYGNDLVHGAALPTQVAMTSDIPRALGYMAPPVLSHLYVDNFWHELGSTLDRVRYLADVVVEHMHPLVGKAADDEGYRRVNAPDRHAADRAAFEGYMHDGFAGDVAKVRAVMVPRG